MNRALLYLAWVLLSVYCTIPLFWLSIHPLAAHWRTRGRSAYRILLPLWGVYAVFGLVVTYPWLHTRFYQNWASLLLGFAILALGLFTYTRALPSFSKVQISGLPELEPERHRQELMTSGIRQRVRHPIYLAHLLEAAGWTVISGSLALVVLFLFALVTGALMIRMEDDELEQRFGEQYRSYRESVPAIIPKLL